jgi:hypothetical protein
MHVYALLGWRLPMLQVLPMPQTLHIRQLSDPAALTALVMTQVSARVHMMLITRQQQPAAISTARVTWLFTCTVVTYR